MQRYSTLALLALTMVTAGCLGGPAADATTTDATPGTAPTTELPTTGNGGPATVTTTTTPDAHDRWLRGDVVEVSPADIARQTSEPLSEVDPDRRSLYRTAVENGSVARTFLDEAPRGVTARPVRANGTYYAIERTVRSRETVEAHLVDLELTPDQSASDPIPFEDLSPAARGAFLGVLPPQERLDDVSGFALRDYHRFENGTPPADAPALDGERHAIEYDGTVYDFELGGETSTTRMDVEYSASAVAESRRGWQSRAIERHVTNFSAASLDGKAREKLVAAIDSGEIEFHSPNPSVPEWVETLRDWTRTHRFVSYRGQLYDLQIYFVME